MSDFTTGPGHDGGHPFLVSPTLRSRPEAVVLVLHGGAEHSTDRTTKWAPPVLRMLPFARDLRRRSRGRLAPYVLRDAVRGYNDDKRSPVVDARWALERIRELHPGRPVGLLGHSMGGRVALELAGSDGVEAVVGLAPWVPEQYDVTPFLDLHTLLLHGSHDRVTDPRETKKLAARIAAAGGDARFESLPDWHAMLRRSRSWHRLSSQFLEKALLPARGIGDS
ncbi:alpha/beta fold hydrolase [Flexivirga sp. ID2601S]|uniref:Alpha/beta fold hydrolase n=1 Tax=Flexivirga aerilata TaxID=1656889 RepID=A0A849ACQ3_9MICO|nr:alpha/beta fold hydrolase [Flexivirga aerilata]NNG38654.1 alpha/beta fold hydrolase [Flexivirga aerilata]